MHCIRRKGHYDLPFREWSGGVVRLNFFFDEFVRLNFRYEVFGPEVKKL